MCVLTVVLIVFNLPIECFLYLHPMWGNTKILSYKDQTQYGKGSIIPHSWASHENRFNARSKPFIASIRRKGPICCWLQLQDSVTDCLEIDKTDRQTYKQADRQTDRQTNKEIGRQANKQETEKQTNRQRHTDRQTDRYQIETQKDRTSGRQEDGQADRQTDRWEMGTEINYVFLQTTYSVLCLQFLGSK